MEYSHVTHEDFGPEYDEKSRILILGSVPSVKSRELAFYYGHPQNRFWRVLYLLKKRGCLEIQTSSEQGKETEQRAENTGNEDIGKKVKAGVKMAESAKERDKGAGKKAEVATAPPVSWARSADQEASLREIFPDFPWSREEKRHFLHTNRIAAWDTISECDIKGSSDASIKNVVPSDIPMLLAACPIRVILCNGASSYRYFQKYLTPLLDDFYRERPGSRRVLVRQVPSTSPANAAWSLEDLTGAWEQAIVESFR